MVRLKRTPPPQDRGGDGTVVNCLFHSQEDISLRTTAEMFVRLYYSGGTPTNGCIPLPSPGLSGQPASSKLSVPASLKAPVSRNKVEMWLKTTPALLLWLHTQKVSIATSQPE